MICPNCDTALTKDEQLIIAQPSPSINGFTVTHVQIYATDTHGLTIEQICHGPDHYTRLAIN